MSTERQCKARSGTSTALTSGVWVSTHGDQLPRSAPSPGARLPGLSLSLSLSLSLCLTCSSMCTHSAWMAELGKALATDARKWIAQGEPQPFPFHLKHHAFE